MKKPSLQLFLLVIPILFLLLVLNSCSTTKNIKYFKDIPDSGQVKTIAPAEYNSPTIQVDDILTILVETVDPTATSTINLGNIPLQAPAAVGNASLTQQPLSGYLVNKEGFVEVPVLGRIKVLGLTTEEAKKLVLTEAVKYFKDPTVIVRYANFKVNITGEVLKPGQYIMPNEKVSIIDAIAIAGDLTIFGKRDNVLLIRENLDGSKTTYRFNLNKSDIMSSPYYYLHQNDVIYVEPGKGKAAANDASQTRTYGILAAIASVLIIIATRVNIK